MNCAQLTKAIDKRTYSYSAYAMCLVLTIKSSLPVNIFVLYYIGNLLNGGGELRTKRFSFEYFFKTYIFSFFSSFNKNYSTFDSIFNILGFRPWFPDVNWKFWRYLWER